MIRHKSKSNTGKFIADVASIPFSGKLSSGCQEHVIYVNISLNLLLFLSLVDLVSPCLIYDGSNIFIPC